MFPFSKPYLRKYFISLRRNLTKQEKGVQEVIINNQLIEFLQHHREWTKIGIYVAKDDEVNLKLLIRYCQKSDIDLFLPRVHDQHLHYYAFESNSSLEFNSDLNIYEPLINSTDCSCRLDVVITPLVAFDNNNSRLGYGTGCFDRFFKNYENLLKIGVGFACQECPSLPTDKWDVPLNLIIHS